MTIIYDEKDILRKWTYWCRGCRNFYILYFKIFIPFTQPIM